MTPAFHLLIAFARIRRIGGVVSFFLLLAGAGSVWLMIDLDIPREINLPVVGCLLLALVGKEALPMLKPGLARTDGLAISATGLTFTRNGRTVEWRWDEISDLRVRSRLHPASLFLGKFISFRVPPDERRRTPGIGHSLWLGGGAVAIGDDFLGRPADLLLQMEHFRANAPAVGRRPVTPPPAAAWSFRKDRKKPKLVHLLLAVGAPVIGLVVARAVAGKFPESVGQFFNSPGVSGALSSAAAMLPFLLMMQFRLEAKQDNMLVMSAGGLHTRFKIERRLWLWRDIVDMQVKESASRGKGGGVAQVVSFTATHDGSRPGREAEDGETLVPVSCSIEDNYETPVEEIARQARAWWQWSGATFGHTVAAAATSQRSAPASRETGAISFRKLLTGAANGRNSLLDQVVPFVFLAPVLVYAGVSIWMLKTDADFGLPWWVGMAGMTIVTIGPIFAMISIIQPGLNRLELTGSGLEHVRYGFKRRWAWHELGSAELRRPRTKWSAKQRSVVTLEAPAAGWTYGLLRWAFNIDNRRLAVIEDIYDSPLDEIVEALNARRRTHGGRAAPWPAE